MSRGPGLRRPLAMLPFASTVVEAATDLALNSSYHGPAHWHRVALNGIEIGYPERADLHVVLAFALIHDAFRQDDGTDPRHGVRAAQFVIDLWCENQAALAPLDGDQIEKLAQALEGHNDGGTSDDATIGTCWDADRLDLPRVGITPRPEFFSTLTGRRMVENSKFLTLPRPRRKGTP